MVRHLSSFGRDVSRGSLSLRSGRHKEGARGEIKRGENEVRDASLTLGKTKRGLGKTKEGLLGREDGVERDCHPEHSEESSLALPSLRSE